MKSALVQLLSNPAFWVFLGTFVTAYYGYKAVARRYPSSKKAVKNASSFEELRAVVEVLQGELVKKDKRHKDDTDYLLSQLRELRDDNRQLTNNLAIALKENADLKVVIEALREQVRHHENRLNKAHIAKNGDAVDGDKTK